MSMAPNLASAAATIFFGASSPVISQPKAAMALLPACACSIADSGRSTASTCAPSSAKSLAEAAPMPEAAPVTIAILPASLLMAPSSFHFDARRLRHSLPQRQVLRQHLGESLGARTDGIRPEHQQPFACLRCQRGLDKRTLELADDNPRAGSRGPHDPPEHEP